MFFKINKRIKDSQISKNGKNILCEAIVDSENDSKAFNTGESLIQDILEN